MAEAETLDRMAADVIDPDFYQAVRDGHVTYHLCGINALRARSKHGWMYVGGTRKRPEYFLIGGPLPNGRFYVPCWNIGHETSHRIYQLLGIPWGEADFMCKGL